MYEYGINENIDNYLRQLVCNLKNLSTSVQVMIEERVNDRTDRTLISKQVAQNRFCQINQNRKAPVCCYVISTKVNFVNSAVILNSSS